MTGLKDLVIDIQFDIEYNQLSFEQIAQKYAVSTETVQEIANSLNEYYNYTMSYQTADVGCEFDPKVQ